MAFSGRRHDHLYNGNMGSLNTIPNDYDMAMQQQQDGYSIQAELDMFTNTQFFDFDMGDMPESTQPIIDPSSTNSPRSVDYLNDFQFSNFNNVNNNSQPTPTVGSTLQSQQSLSRQQSQFPQRNNSSSASSPSANSSQPPVDKRKTEEPQSLEEASRLAAEEDKRRRNTAASARFRVKKKQREQALEKTAKEMTDRVNFLESRVGQLEMENKLLKDLITEKSGKEVDIAELKRQAEDNSSGSSTVKAELGDVR